MRKTSIGIGLVVALLFAACASAPQTRPDQRALEARADATVARMEARDPTLAGLLANSVGYIVFPEVTTGGMIVGGASSVGVVYEHGRPIGYSELRAGSIGAQIGGETYSQLIVFDQQSALDRMRAGNFDLSAGLTATAVTSGASAHAPFENGTAVLIDNESGLMAAATVGGEQLSFTAK